MKRTFVHSNRNRQRIDATGYLKKINESGEKIKNDAKNIP